MFLDFVLLLGCVFFFFAFSCVSGLSVYFFAAGRPAVLCSLCFPSVACVCLFFFYFLAIFTCFLPSGWGVGFLWRGVQKGFFFRFFFWGGVK